MQELRVWCVFEDDGEYQTGDLRALRDSEDKAKAYCDQENEAYGCNKFYYEDWIVK